MRDRFNRQLKYVDILNLLSSQTFQLLTLVTILCCYPVDDLDLLPSLPTVLFFLHMQSGSASFVL